jgi:hypothetical protein
MIRANYPQEISMSASKDSRRFVIRRLGLLFLFTLASLVLAACQVEETDEVTFEQDQLPQLTLPPSSDQPLTFYIRPDGGSAQQCTGLVDAAYPGQGVGVDCAWNHPFQALPPGASARIRGGDTLIIAQGSYPMGIGSPGSQVCDQDGPWDCHLSPIPSGISFDRPTRILGEGWDSGCQQPPELWGVERAAWILDLTDSNHVEVACLEITDHSGCVEDHTGGLACQRDEPPYGDWASAGLYAQDSSDVHLADLNIHGLASTGIWAGRLEDWTLERVRIAANGWVGWDGDIDGDDGNHGDMVFREWQVVWNGCGESYPEGDPMGCWSQTAGGYGDGVGTGDTGGHWLIEDSLIAYNTSDGLDLLYARESDSEISVLRSIFIGNAGNQIKTNGSVYLENVLAVGNCAFFEGQDFTFNVDPCRAGGNTLSFTLRPGQSGEVWQTTVAGQGDCLMEIECEGGCDGSERLQVFNSIFQGGPEYADPSDMTCLAWTAGFPTEVLALENSLVNRVKAFENCPGTGVRCGVDPGWVRGDLSDFDGHLTTGSPAIDAGRSDGAPEKDLEGNPRIGLPDLGAYEFE